MTPLFKKLNLKETHQQVLILQAPQSFLAEVSEIRKSVAVTEKLNATLSIDLALAFVTLQQQVNNLAPAIITQLKDDSALWFCYPKGTSKKYTCDFNRDNGWAILGELGFEPVRMVAIDEDWSALRFRRVQHIKKMTRSFALTQEGKKKAGINL